jgi:hypothetical protein
LLPNELVVSIFNQLSVSILLRLSRTCKALHHYAHLVTAFDTSFRSLYSSLPRKHLVHTNYDLKKAAQLLFLINRHAAVLLDLVLNYHSQIPAHHISALKLDIGVSLRRATVD